MMPTEAKSGRGRPREFDYDEVVERAVTLFRQQGYGATSIADLVEATQLTRGSLYKAFKDKKTLYIAAFERYVQRGHERMRAIAVGEGTGRQRVERLLADYVEQASGEPGRLGCLVVATGIEASVLEPDVVRLFEQALKYLERTLLDLIKIGLEDKSIPDRVNAKVAARTLLCCLQGLRVVGKSDEYRKHLNKDMLVMAMKMLD